MIKITSKARKNSIDNLEYVEPEIWKYIEGYEGRYEVSNRGRIRSFIRGGKKGTIKRKHPLVLSQWDAQRRTD